MYLIKYLLSIITEILISLGVGGYMAVHGFDGFVIIGVVAILLIRNISIEMYREYLQFRRTNEIMFMNKLKRFFVN